MALEPFASATEMEARSLGQITTASHPFLDSALKAASKVIRNECRWHVAKLQQVTRRSAGPAGRRDLWLQGMAIASIDELKVDGTVFDITGASFDPDTGWTSIQLWGSALEVKFTCGYEEVPDDIVDLTLQVASRALGSPLGALREQTLASSVTWSATASGVAGGTVLLEHEKDQLSEYRLGRRP